jgi:AICAR transformylase/IMP cyclohydrolase PurH
LAVGGGPSTLEAAQIALMRAKRHGNSLHGSVFAANAYFPFTDAPETLCHINIKAGLVPGGGKRFKEVRGVFRKNNVSVIYLPEKYRGFCRH